MYIQIMAAVALTLLLTGCGSLPSTKVKTNEFILENGLALKAKSIVDPKDIKLYQRQYPIGIEKNGDLLQVKKGYEDKLEILGVINISLKNGRETSPFPLGPKGNIYVNNEDLSGLHKYCQSMSWQNGVFMLLMWVPNYLAPWNWPCYFQKDHSSESEKDLEYRTETLIELSKKEASKLGGNAIIGFNIGGISYINAANGATVANTDAWSATGFVVRFKE